jgi:hypothetical protein
MEHRFLKVFVDGVWPRPDRIIKVNGVEHDMDEYAKEHGITLPDSKKKINKDVKEKDHADMEHKDHSRDIEVDGDGDSEG